MGNTNNTQPAQKEDAFPVKYYKSAIAGLAIHLSSEEPRDEAPERVRFTAYEFFDEEKGDRYNLGFLETSDPNVQEILAEDSNVTELTKKEYTELLADRRPARN